MQGVRGMIATSPEQRMPPTRWAIEREHILGFNRMVNHLSEAGRNGSDQIAIQSRDVREHGSSSQLLPSPGD